MRAAFRFRLRLILAGIVLITFLIIVRLYIIQIMYGEEYSFKAERQYVSSVNTLFDRGSIFFTRKDGTYVSAATLGTGFLVAINPQTLTDPEAAYSAIVEVASSTIDKELFLKTSKNSDVVYAEVAHHLSESAGKMIADKKIRGVKVLRERWRTYPGDELASQTIGVVALQAKDDILKGRTGLEAVYDDALSRNGDGLYKNFFAALFSNLGNALLDARDAKEGDVVTSLEPNVLTRLVSDLEKVSDTYHSKESGGIIMDPATGEILALATAPSYNANDFQNVTGSLLANPLVEHVYEFGSIMKALTMASAIDSGAVTANTTYKDTGCLTLDTLTICNYDGKARGVVPMQEILSQSLNVGAAYLANELGAERFRKYFTSLGFGEKTGIDLPAETSGLVGNLNSPRQIEYATTAFGQGIAVTPLEMIRALSTLANGGVAATPHIGRAIKLNSGLSKALTWGEGRRVFSAESARQVSQMLTAVVDKSLAHGKVMIPTMSVAAKTGTAQLTDPSGGYYKDRYFHSIFGYFPSYEPKFIILLYTNDPQGVQYASETLTSTFIDLVHFLINYYDVPPDRSIVYEKNP